MSERLVEIQALYRLIQYASSEAHALDNVVLAKILDAALAETSRVLRVSKRTKPGPAHALQ